MLAFSDANDIRIVGFSPTSEFNLRTAKGHDLDMIGWATVAAYQCGGSGDNIAINCAELEPVVLDKGKGRLACSMNLGGYLVSRKIVSQSSTQVI